MKQMHWNAKHLLMEEGGFVLVAQPKEYWVSWVSHKACQGEPPLTDTSTWRWVNIYEEVCPYCGDSVPEGIKGAWILHNYENHIKALHIRARKGDR